MTKILSLFAAAATVFLLAMSTSYADTNCATHENGFLPCAEGQLSADKPQLGEMSTDAYMRHPRRPPRYPRPYPHYPPPAPFCYTPSGYCRMVVATPPRVPCTCNFGYYWDNGFTGY